MANEILDAPLQLTAAPERLSQRYSFLVIAWDAADLPHLIGAIAAAVPRSAIAQGLIPKPPHDMSSRHDVFVALENAVSAHATRAREAGLLPVAVLSNWNAALSGLEEAVKAEELAPALAILSTPEVLWLFASDTKVDDVPWPKYHSLEQITRGLWDPTFDWTGLRWWIRNQLLGLDHKYLESQRVVALDDECRYREFEAYCGYRFGYPALAPASMEEAREFLDPGKFPEFTEHLHTFEDIYIRFYDQTCELTDPQARDDALPALGKALTRTIVSSGGRACANWRDLEKNHATGSIKLVFKPVKGLLDLWTASPAKTRGKPALSHWASANQVANSPLTMTQSTHAAPGAITLTAAKMLLRAERLSRSDAGFSDLLLAATLCVDVELLLSGRSPTTALEAISIKHQAEARLECVFHGVAAAPNIHARLIELQTSIQNICMTYDNSARRDATLAANIEVLNQLISIFRQYGRFEEEQKLLNDARDLRCRIRWRGTGAQPLEALALLYPNFILRSPYYFAVAFIAGMIAFAWLYVPFQPGVAGKTLLWRALITTVAMQPPVDYERSNVIDFLCMVWGLGHFGVFLSHLYNLILRR